MIFYCIHYYVSSIMYYLNIIKYNNLSKVQYYAVVENQIDWVSTHIVIKLYACVVSEILLENFTLKFKTLYQCNIRCLNKLNNMYCPISNIYLFAIGLL